MIGSYLLAVGAAEPVDDDVPETVPAPDRQLFGPAVVKNIRRAGVRPGIVNHPTRLPGQGMARKPLPGHDRSQVERDQAADRSAKKKKRR